MNAHATRTSTRWYIGSTPDGWQPFAVLYTPTVTTHGMTYGAVVGPFRSSRDAQCAALHGTGAYISTDYRECAECVDRRDAVQWYAIMTADAWHLSRSDRQMAHTVVPTATFGPFSHRYQARRAALHQMTAFAMTMFPECGDCSEIASLA